MRVVFRLALSCCALLLLAGCFGEAGKTVEPSQTAAGPASARTAPREPSRQDAAVPEPSGGESDRAAKAAPAPGGAADATPAASAQAPSSEPASAAPEKAEPADTPAANGEAGSVPDKSLTVAALDASPAPKPATSATIGGKGGAHIAVVGDSLAVGVGMTMERNLKQYEGVACTALGKVSTGLIAKKKYDWDRSLDELIRTNRPDALVVVMGGNDSNNNIGGKAAGSDAWKEAYSGKVKDFLKIASDGGVMVFWAGLPIMKDEAYSKRVEAANEAAKNACQTFSNCVYIDSWSMFTDENGGYADEKSLDGGKTVSLRAKDGVHLTMTGYDYLCREILDKVAKNVELKPKSAK